MTIHGGVPSPADERPVPLPPITLPLAALLRWAVLTALAVWMAIEWGHLVATVIRYYSPLPFWDYWETVTWYERLLHGDFAGALWNQHNEHRMLFPRLIFAADYAFFAGREILPLALNVIFYFGTWLLLAAAIYRIAASLFLRLSAVLIAGIVMAWEAGALEIAGAFLVQWTLMFAAVTLGLFLLGKTPGAQRPWLYLGLAIACAVVATYSVANALFVWPILVIAAWMLRLRPAQLTAIAVSGVLFAGIYFVGFRFSQSSSSGGILSHPIYAAGFIAAYLGAPFTVARLWLGIAIGAISVILFACCCVLVTRRHLLNSTTGVLLLGLYSLCFITALLTTVGRMNPADPEFGAATAQRYVIVPLLADACLLLIAAWLFAFRHTYLWAVAAFLFVGGLYSTDRSVIVRSWCAFPKQLLVNTQFVAMAVQSGIDDPVLLKTVYPDVDLVRAKLALLRAHRWSSFADKWAAWTGKPAQSVVRVISETPIAGAVTHVSAIQDALIVSGWTDSPRRLRSPQRLVFINELGRLMGLAETLPGGIPADFAWLDTPQSLAWIGFVNLNVPSQSFAAYALERGALIRVGKVTPVPRSHIAITNQVGAVLGPFNWQIKGSWLENGPLPLKPDNMPMSGNYYESWGGADANTGVIRSGPFRAPEDHCIVLSGANGPSTNDLSETLVDSDTHEAIASAPLNGRDTNWHSWAVTVPASVKQVELFAEDDGRGWGAWLSIGEPRSCK